MKNNFVKIFALLLTTLLSSCGGSKPSTSNNSSSVFIENEIDIPQTKEGNYRIMSYNIRVTGDTDNSGWQARRKVIAKKVHDGNPDIIGFQEVNTGMQESTLKEVIGDDYSSVFYGRDGDKGEGVPIYYKTDMFSLISQGVFWLSETPNEVSKYSKAQTNRICVYVELEDKATHKQIAYYNTHLSVESNESAQFGASVIRGFISNKNYSNDTLIVVGGDFNSTPDSNAYGEMINAYYVDSGLSASEKMSGCTYHDNKLFKTEAEGGTRIDYLFLKNSTSIEYYLIFNTKIDDTIASDHYAIMISTN